MLKAKHSMSERIKMLIFAQKDWPNDWIHLFALNPWTAFVGCLQAFVVGAAVGSITAVVGVVYGAAVTEWYASYGSQAKLSV